MLQRCYMEKKFKIKLGDLRQVQLKEVFQILEKVFDDHGIEFYVFGALARDTWYTKESIDSRTTRDVDFALYVFSQEQYEEIIAKLVEEHGFSGIKGIPFRLQTPFGYTIDLIPFGEISIDDAVLPDKNWDRPVFVNGFEEILHEGIATVEVEAENLTFKVATLPAIILLKLISYDDRPERRTQDPIDIADIIQHYFDIESMVIWEYHNDLFEQDLALNEIAAVVIGREIKDILADNRALKERVLRILSLQNQTQQKMAEEMVQDDCTLEEIEQWFKLIKKGIEEDAPRRSENL